jgi:hypothetical protein
MAYSGLTFLEQPVAGALSTAIETIRDEPSELIDCTRFGELRARRVEQ